MERELISQGSAVGAQAVRIGETMIDQPPSALRHVSSSLPTVVYKVGGSLFDLPDLAPRLQRLFLQRPAARPLLVAGGGKAADLVRAWDAAHQLGNSTAHRLAIRAMSFNAHRLAERLPGGTVVADRESAAAAWRKNGRPILTAHEFLFPDGLEIRPAEDADALPESWDVTSDSIAAWVALHWPAEELVLVKSCDPDAAAVDAFFPRLAHRIAGLGWVNLRGDPTAIRPWRIGPAT